MFRKFLFVIVAVALGSARPDGFDYDDDDDHSSEEYGVYQFQYAIDDPHSGNHYGHAESRSGGRRTEGRYYVRLPDTRLMIVEYYADETGYHPTITYEGEAQYPSAPQQSFSEQNYNYQAPQENFVHEEPQVVHQETHSETIIEPEVHPQPSVEYQQETIHDAPAPPPPAPAVVQHIVEEPSSEYSLPQLAEASAPAPSEYTPPSYS